MLHRTTDRSDQPSKQGEGQSAVEFALVAPLLFALLVGMLLLAWIGFTYVSVSSAARMGVRHLISYPIVPEDTARFGNDADAEITHVITSAMPGLDWARATIVISPTVTARTSEIPVEVQVSYPLNLPTVRVPYVIREGSFTLIPPLALDAVARMWLE
mgnify:CR=1 FL=1